MEQGEGRTGNIRRPLREAALPFSMAYLSLAIPGEKKLCQERFLRIASQSDLIFGRSSVKMKKEFEKNDKRKDKEHGLYVRTF